MNHKLVWLNLSSIFGDCQILQVFPFGKEGFYVIETYRQYWYGQTNIVCGRMLFEIFIIKGFATVFLKGIQSLYRSREALVQEIVVEDLFLALLKNELH